MDTTKLFSQSIKDSIGLIVDRTVDPELVLGQVCLISKARVATCASSVFNYVNHPFALAVKFPHPDFRFAVRSISLHPNFDKALAQNNYILAAQGVLSTAQDNDLAALVIEENFSEPTSDKIAQLNLDLSIPIVANPQDLQGGLKIGELPSLLQNILPMGVQGLLTILDERNFPIARLSLGQGRIQKVMYAGLVGEAALFELVYRKPPGKFLFHTPDNYSWQNTKEISVAHEVLLGEAIKRAQQLPSMIDSLGGRTAIYERRANEFDKTNANPKLVWIEEIIFTVLDGYLNLDNLSRRAGADTGSVVLALQELIGLGAIQLRTSNPFRRGEDIGPPIMPQPDISVWDPVKAVYIDPLSGKLGTEEGNFFGPARPNEPKKLLHTVVLSPDARGAAILKENLLVGIHSGTFVPGPDQQSLPGQLSQMMWAGALQDLSSARARSAGDDEDSNAQGTTGKNVRSAPTIICPQCQTANYIAGTCISCGGEIAALEPPLPVLSPDEAHAEELKHLAIKKANRTKLGIGAGVLVVLALVFVVMGSRQSATVGNTTPTQTPVKPDAPAAIAIIQNEAMLKGAHPPGYFIEDSSASTGNMPSVTISSESGNQKILVIVWNNASIADNLDLIDHKIPFTDFDNALNLESIRVDRGEASIAGQPMNWFVGKYTNSKDGTQETVLVGSCKRADGAKAIVVIGRPLRPEPPAYDYKTALWLIDTMATAGAPAAPKAQTEPKTEPAAEEKPTPAAAPVKKVATAEELASYRKQVETVVNSKYVAEDGAAKAKLFIVFGLTKEGMLTKMELTEPSGNEEIDQSVIKALTASQPYPTPPQTDETVMKLRLDAKGLHVE